jgi:quercetin dioxygenase-like cupin family protein
MAKKGDHIENKITGEKITFIETSHDTNGQKLKMEFVVKPKGHDAAYHIHPRQDETFHITKGNLKVRKGKEIIYLKTGDTLVIPKNTPHQWWNESNEEIFFTLEFNPALNMETFLEQLTGLCNDGKTTPKGLPYFWQIMAMTKKYEIYIAGVPMFIQKIISATLGPLANLMGYKSYYAKYSG